MLDYDGKQWLGEFLQNRTYAAVKEDGTKESRAETINRTKEMHIKRFPDLKGDIEEWFEQVHAGRVVPSMRSLQFGGSAIERVNARMYNCAFANLTTWDDFHDGFYLLMCGTGFGYSVKNRHITQLPKVKKQVPGAGTLTYTISDSKEGWADSVRILLANPYVEFDYSHIRPKGALISSGGSASGPEALQKTHTKVREVLVKAAGRKLYPIECHDIMCHIADGVVVGGVRRAALICLFDESDEDMQKAKSGNWWEFAPQRARANNSAVIWILEGSDEEVQDNIRETLSYMFESGSGEPGISLTRDPDYGYNPCHEISLKDGGLCNLTEINLKACKDLEDLMKAAEAATAIGTLQASYTYFPTLQDKWTKNAKQEALLGVSATGQADNWALWSNNMQAVATRCRLVNLDISRKIGVNQAYRLTTTKPSGSTSAWLGCSSGIHADHSEYYIRHVRMEKDHKIVEAVKKANYPFVEVDKMDPDKMVIGFPIKANKGAILKGNETAIELLERAKKVHKEWVQEGHRSGPNTHNVSLTVEYKDGEEEGIIDWMTSNYEHYAGISFLPRVDSVYEQMPFQEISKGEYEAMVAKITQPIDYNSVNWVGTVDERMGELACANGSCEIE